MNSRLCSHLYLLLKNTSTLRKQLFQKHISAYCMNYLKQKFQNLPKSMTGLNLFL